VLHRGEGGVVRDQDDVGIHFVQDRVQELEQPSRNRRLLPCLPGTTGSDEGHRQQPPVSPVGRRRGQRLEQPGARIP